jgi:DNA polymerase
MNRNRVDAHGNGRAEGRRITRATGLKGMCADATLPPKSPSPRATEVVVTVNAPGAAGAPHGSSSAHHTPASGPASEPSPLFAPPPDAPATLLPLYNTDEALRPLYEEIADCPNCALARTRSRTVPGSGPLSSDIMFIGEGPGQREDELGIPFVGRAGTFLDQLLAGIELDRTQVYVANVVKCRPPGNRDPQPEELAACASFLTRQIELVDPLVIATLGRYSMAPWFPGERISRIHGQERVADGRIVIPMYHPAAALRNGSLREVMHADFARLPALVAAAAARRSGAPAADNSVTPPTVASAATRTEDPRDSSEPGRGRQSPAPPHGSRQPGTSSDPSPSPPAPPAPPRAAERLL